MRFPKDHVCAPSPAGSRYETIWKVSVRKDGKLNFEEDGKKDIQEEIDSWREITDMSFILKQMELGNYEVLNRSPGMYGDFTTAPKNMQEAMQIMIDAEKAFYKLPVDIRRKFDNDYMHWLATAGEEEWIKKMEFTKESETSKEEVNEDVS